MKYWLNIIGGYKKGHSYPLLAAAEQQAVRVYVTQRDKVCSGNL
jgi:hypothetical protein